MNLVDKIESANFNVDFGGLDLSDSRQSVGYLIGSLETAADNEKVIAVEIEWPATGSPNGTFRIGFCCNRDAATALDHPYVTSAASPAKPTSIAGRVLIDRIKTAAPILVVNYDRTSGGTGCFPTITVSR